MIHREAFIGCQAIALPPKPDLSYDFFIAKLGTYPFAEDYNAQFSIYGRTARYKKLWLLVRRNSIVVSIVLFPEPCRIFEFLI